MQHEGYYGSVPVQFTEKTQFKPSRNLYLCLHKLHNLQTIIEYLNHSIIVMDTQSSHVITALKPAWATQHIVTCTLVDAIERPVHELNPTFVVRIIAF